jgi:hypothetical protein
MCETVRIKPKTSKKLEVTRMWNICQGKPKATRKGSLGERPCGLQTARL